MTDTEIPDEERILGPDTLFAKAMLGAFPDRGFILMVFPPDAKSGDGYEYLTNLSKPVAEMILGRSPPEKQPPA